MAQLNLDVRRTELRYRLFGQIVVALAAVAIVWVGGHELAPVWGRTTSVQVNVALSVSIALTFSMSLVGVAEVLNARRLKRELTSVEEENELLQDELESADEEIRELELQVDRLTRRELGTPGQKALEPDS